MSDESGLRTGAWPRRLLQGLRRRGSSAYPKEHLSRSAIVFSPHFDDETLGCGGLIIKKKRAGADIKIVFMTDGSGSHQNLMPRHELAAMRLAEAIAAAKIMGLREEDVISLGFVEQRLCAHGRAAVERVAGILERYRPEELWIPHSREPLIWSPDHRETTKIVKQAARVSGGSYAVFEYPVWLWFNYPWIDLPAASGRETRHLIKTSLAGAFGFHLTRTCNLELDIRDVLELKRTALAAHRSQMSRVNSDPSWATLGDVANGQFLQCFFQPREIFATAHLDELK